MTHSSTRIHSIDILRGLAVVIMTVDHVREYFFFAMPLPDPMNLEQIGLLTFLTRWLTHFCAPAFIFLTGLSAYLNANRSGLSRPALSTFLLKRGLLFMALEVTLVNFAWTFSFPPAKIFLQVIWATGLSMICLAGLIWLPLRIMLGLAIAIIAGHNVFDTLVFEEGTVSHWLWAIAHQRSMLHVGDIVLRTSYPVLPWIGVMALGYVFGGLYRDNVPAQRRHRILTRSGMAVTIAFFALRATKIYGDHSPWHHYDGQPLITFMSFLNLTKYPPSLLFLLMTLGPALLLLRQAEHWKGRVQRILLNFGRVPFMYYILHLYALHLAYRICGVAAGYHWDGTPATAGIRSKFDVGSIFWVWAIAAVTCAALYPLVILGIRLKREKNWPILRYL